MCLVLFAYQPDSEHALVVAANRDELYARPAESAHCWPESPQLLAGRDLSAGGTWLGVTNTGRFATVTNFAEEGPADALRSRGELTQSFLLGDMPAHDFAHLLQGAEYRGFNLLVLSTSAEPRVFTWDGALLAESTATNQSATARSNDQSAPFSGTDS